MDPAVSKDRYRRLTDHFQRCVELSPPKRRGYVATLSFEDAELGVELQELLRQHAKRYDSSGAPLLLDDAVPPHVSPAPSDRKKVTPWIIMIAAITVVLLLLPFTLRMAAWISASLFLGVGSAILALYLLRRRRTARPEDHPVGSYVIERCIGRGATADIFLAHHALLKRAAALKILKDARPSRDTARRFEREARLASRLGHPNTIQVFDYGKASDGRLFLAMEYVQGLNLSQLLAFDQHLPIARVVHILKQIAGSLDDAHRMGLVHRDLKPLNIMLSSKGGIGDTVKVLDFGLASQLSGADEDVVKSEAIVGTPAFMAPERFWAPLQMDPRSDIYSFGAVAFQLLTGRSVFESGGPAELMYQVLTACRPSPSQLRGERIPDELEILVLDCLAVSPALRPPTFGCVKDALRKVPLGTRWGRDEAHQWWSDHREKASHFLQATV